MHLRLMGRTGSNAASMQLQEMRPAPAVADSAESRFRALQEEKINLHFASSDEEVVRLVEMIKAMNPKVLAVDFETATKNGRFGSANGALRLIQLGIDEPGKEPMQVVIDCFHADPGPVRDLFRDEAIEKQIHYMDFEQEWAQLHLGAEIRNVYDTCLAFQTIQKKLAGMDPEEAEKVLPGWQKHDNRLATLLRNYLGLEMPKENQASDWGREKLRPSQIVYATMDVVTLPLLVEKVKEIAERAGASKDVENRTSWVGRKIKERVRDFRASRDDDSERVLRAMSRCRNRQELDRLYTSARQMTLFASEGPKLRREYKRLSAELS